MENALTTVTKNYLNPEKPKTDPDVWICIGIGLVVAGTVFGTVACTAIAKGRNVEISTPLASLKII